MTDVACMTLVKKNGGRSIAVYSEKENSSVKKLYEDGRVSFICRSDYSSNSDLEKVMLLIIDSISTYNEIEKKQETLALK